MIFMKEYYDLYYLVRKRYRSFEYIHQGFKQSLETVRINSEWLAYITKNITRSLKEFSNE